MQCFAYSYYNDEDWHWTSTDDKKKSEDEG